jgi:hypothetical protein
MDAATLAEIVLVAHVLYAGFVVTGFVTIPLGAALRWRWVRNRAYRLIHVAAIAFVGFEGAIGMVCPLTELEYQLRRQAGLEADEGSFIGRMAASVLYYDFPVWAFTTAYVLLTALAVALLFLVRPEWKRQ